MSKRVILYTKDIVLITGRSENYARKLLRQVRLKNNKPPKSLVSIKEIAEFLSITESEIKDALKL